MVDSPTTQSHARHWAVLVGCCLLVGFGFTIPMLSFGVFLSPMVAYFDCSVTEVSIYFTFIAASAVFSSALGARFLHSSMRATVVVSSFAIGLAFFALALFPAVPMVWVTGVVAGLGFPLCSTVLVPIAINKWFAVRQGTFIGIALAMVGVFGMMFSPAFTAIIGAWGWRVALVVAGTMLIVANCLVAFFLLRQDPALLGLKPYGFEDHVAEAVQEAGVSAEEDLRANTPVEEITPAEENLDASSLLRRKAFWLCAVAALIGGFFGVYNSQLNTVAQTSGFDPVVAGLALSSASAGLMVGKVFMGWLKDQKGSTFAICFGCASGIVAFLITAFGVTSGNVAFLYLGAVLAGCCTCLATLSAAFLASAAFEPALYSQSVAYLTSFCNLGMALGVPFYSVTYDLVGSYLPVLLACAVIPVICALVAATGIRVGRKTMEQAA